MQNERRKRLGLERLESRYALSGTPIGDQTVLFMPVDFPDRPGAAQTNEQLTTTLSSVNADFNFSSYGKLTLTAPVITPLLRMPQPSTYYQTQSTSVFRDDARAAATALGFDYASYFAHVTIAAPDSVYIGKGGRGFTGGWAHLNGAYNPVTLGHELGHVMRLGHAAAWDTTTDDPFGPGSWIEYGNPFSVMGSGGRFGQMNVYEKAKLGWLDAATDTVTVTQTGTYRLHAFDLGETSVDKTYALQIPQAPNTPLWIEYRQWDLSNVYYKDAVILTGDPTDNTNKNPVFIDTTPGSQTDLAADFKDGTLALHRTFSSASRQIHITPIAKGGSGLEAWIDVRVVFGENPINIAPVLAIGADITYRENAPPRMVAGGAAINDVDSIDFGSGVIRVELTENAEATDALGIRAAGGINSDGETVTYNDIAIGTIAGTLGPSPLVINLNNSANLESTRALLRNLTFANTSDDPSTATRKVAVTVADGDGGSRTSTKRIVMQAVNDRPTIAGTGASVSYAINDPAAVLIGNAFTMSDPDHVEYSGALIKARVIAGQDAGNRIEVGGLFKIESGQIKYNNQTIIGTVNDRGGQGNQSLLLRLNANATQAIAVQLLRSIRFRTEGSSLNADRTLELSVTDPNGAVSNVVSRKVLIV